MSYPKKIKKINYLINKIPVKLLLSRKKFKLENSILIFSEPRTGSTWLMQILNQLPNTVINWEPLHLGKGVFKSKCNWDFRPYFNNDDLDPECIEAMKDVLTLNNYSNWTIKYISLIDLIKSKTVVTKFIRANLIIPWILNNFNFNNPPIQMFRHPIDTNISIIKTFKGYNINKTINDCKYDFDAGFIKSLNTKLEKKIAIWCENYVNLIKNPDIMGETIIVFYEDLITNPKVEVRRIIKKLNVNCSVEKLIQKYDFRKPSRTDFANTLQKVPEEQLRKNIRNLDKKAKKKIQNIFDHYEFNLYNAFTPYPNKMSLKSTYSF